MRDDPRATREWRSVSRRDSLRRRPRDSVRDRARCGLEQPADAPDLPAAAPAAVASISRRRFIPPRNLDVGQTDRRASSRGGCREKSVDHRNPDGAAIEVTVVKKGERGVVEFGKTQRPGLYTLTPPGGPPLHYVVNASRRESDLQKLSPSEIADFAKAHGVAVVHNGAEYKALDQHAALRQGAVEAAFVGAPCVRFCGADS